MTAGLAPVWFERPVPPAFAPLVEGACSVLGPGTEDDPYAGVEGAIAAVVGAASYGVAFLDRARDVRVICRTGIGYDAVDVEAATAHGVLVCNTPDGPTVSTAEHAVTLMLMAAKRVKAAEAALRAGRARDYYGYHDGIELDGKVLGLIGFGRIARRVGRIAEGLGMRPVAFDPYVDHSTSAGGVEHVDTLDELLRVADVVSVHVPLSDASRGMIGAREFEAMKPGAIFINTARGGVVDQDALLAALDAGRLSAAGLDVTSPEPLPPGHPLLGRDDVVVTPHVASATVDGKARIFRAAIEQALAVIDGRRPAHPVNPEVLDRWATTPMARLAP